MQKEWVTMMGDEGTQCHPVSQAAAGSASDQMLFAYFYVDSSVSAASINSLKYWCIQAIHSS